MDHLAANGVHDQSAAAAAAAVVEQVQATGAEQETEGGKKQEELEADGAPATDNQGLAAPPLHQASGDAQQADDHAVHRAESLPGLIQPVYVLAAETLRPETVSAAASGALGGSGPFPVTVIGSALPTGYAAVAAPANEETAATRSASANGAKDAAALSRRRGSRPATEITREDLAACFHLPSEAACRQLNIGLTVLKRQCRRYGIKRWPFRKMKSLDRLISNVQAGISPGEQNRALLKSVEELEEQKRMMARRTFPAEECAIEDLDEETKRLQQAYSKACHKAKRQLSGTPRKRARSKGSGDAEDDFDFGEEEEDDVLEDEAAAATRSRRAQSSNPRRGKGRGAAAAAARRRGRGDDEDGEDGEEEEDDFDDDGDNDDQPGAEPERLPGKRQRRPNPRYNASRFEEDEEEQPGPRRARRGQAEGVEVDRSDAELLISFADVRNTEGDPSATPASKRTAPGGRGGGRPRAAQGGASTGSGRAGNSSDQGGQWADEADVARVIQAHTSGLRQTIMRIAGRHVWEAISPEVKSFGSRLAEDLSNALHQRKSSLGPSESPGEGGEAEEQTGGRRGAQSASPAGRGAGETRGESGEDDPERGGTQGQSEAAAGAGGIGGGASACRPAPPPPPGWPATAASPRTAQEAGAAPQQQAAPGTHQEQEQAGDLGMAAAAGGASSSPPQGLEQQPVMMTT